MVKITQLNSAVLSGTLINAHPSVEPIRCFQMALRKYLKKGDLPTAKETGIGALATKDANAAVSRVIQESPESSLSRKRKHTVFSLEQRAAIGRYAAENSNVAAVKKI